MNHQKNISSRLNMATTSLASNESCIITHIVVTEQSLRQLDIQAAEIEFKSDISKWTE